MIQVKHRWTDAVLCEFDVETTRQAVEKAVSKGAYLRGADLRGADLEGADLRGADLEGADLRGAYLEGADLRGAYLRGAYLRGADLRGAYLTGADLEGADLRGAYLEGADLRGAYLGGADLGGEKLNIAPISILNLTWDILITGEYLKIGCQRHTHEAWANFSDDEIKEMESRASEFWQVNKTWILELCRTHKEQALKASKA